MPQQRRKFDKKEFNRMAVELNESRDTMNKLGSGLILSTPVAKNFR